MDTSLNDLFVRPDYDNARIIVSFTPPPGCDSARWQVRDAQSLVAEGRVALAPEGKVRFEVGLPGFKPWHVSSPYLYSFRLQFDGGLEQTVPFGMRKIHVAGDSIYVNNKPFLVRGFIRGREAHDHPNLENLPPEEYYAKNIRAAKSYGFNFIRFHSTVPPEECFAAADRLGMFIHVEMRKYFGKYQKERADMMFEGELLDEAGWREMVMRLRNHPSLMVYCMGNEIDHPGTNPHVAHITKVTKELDPTRLFVDTCARGEYDRQTVDFDVQHMSYFYPFGKDYGMFENTQNWLIFGSCAGLPMVAETEKGDGTWKVSRAIPSRRPVLAHEVCHYIALRDLDALDAKFQRTGAPRPWWIDELRKLIALKKLEADLPAMLQASQRFQFLSWKLGIEAARRSRTLSGFHFLQFSDTERYENANGVVDCFDEPKGVDTREFLRFNGDTALLADLPRRTYFEKERIRVPVILSHFSPEWKDTAGFRFTLETASGDIVMRGGLDKIALDALGRREICQIELTLPETERATALRLTCQLVGPQEAIIVENAWDLWVYPNRPERLPAPACTVSLDEVNLRARYPQIESKGSIERPEKLLIVNRFSAPVLTHLDQGGDVLMLYRVPETRDRKLRGVPRETYSLPTTWDRFKGVVWDRGTNCGAFLRPSKLWDAFPNDGFLDLQFHALVDDCDKVVLDDFPVPLSPIMQGVDKAARDRFDVYTYGLSEFQPKWTLRKFSYVCELQVEKGRLFLTGLNFTGLSRGVPEACALFEAVLRYVCSNDFRPMASISTQALGSYFLEKVRQPRVKERRMTQYWQLDDAPLESRKYWQESIEYLGEEPLHRDAFLDKKK